MPEFHCPFHGHVVRFGYKESFGLQKVVTSYFISPIRPGYLASALLCKQERTKKRCKQTFQLAVGSSGMAQAPGTASTQNSVLIGLTSAQEAGTLVHLQSSDGKGLFTFKSTKKFQSVAFSSAGLTKGTSFTVYTGGTATGTVTDGLYQDGTYTSGIKFADFTVSSAVTKVGSVGGGGR